MEREALIRDCAKSIGLIVIVAVCWLLLFSLAGCATTMRQDFREVSVDPETGERYESELSNVARAGAFAKQDVELQSWDWQYGDGQHLQAGQSGVQDNAGQVEALKVVGATLPEIAGVITSAIGLPPVGDQDAMVPWLEALRLFAGGDNGLFNALLEWFLK
jgi:hypothetical protein